LVYSLLTKARQRISIGRADAAARSIGHFGIWTRQRPGAVVHRSGFEAPQFHLLDSGSGERVRQQLVSPGQSEEPFGRESARAGTSTDRTMPITQSVRGGRSNEDDQDERTNEGVRVIPRQQIVKGYEAVPNQYVQVTSEELKALEAEANQHAGIQEFVALADIDPVYFEKTYLVGPEKGRRKSTACSHAQCGYKNEARLPSLSCEGRRSWCSYDRLAKTDYC